MRVGTGYDVHALKKGRKLILGGVEIEWPMGLAGHSDADVLVHAICDACLGAVGAGDIGVHFPPEDSRYKDIGSRVLLRKIVAGLHQDNWRVSNLDCTIIAEKPKLRPYIPAMIRHICEDLRVTWSQVNVKATTTEGLGYIGMQKGIAAQAAVLVERYTDQDIRGRER